MAGIEVRLTEKVRRAFQGVADRLEGQAGRALETLTSSAATIVTFATAADTPFALIRKLVAQAASRLSGVRRASREPSPKEYVFAFRVRVDSLKVVITSGP